MYARHQVDPQLIEHLAALRPMREVVRVTASKDSGRTLCDTVNNTSLLKCPDRLAGGGGRLPCLPLWVASISLSLFSVAAIPRPACLLRSSGRRPPSFSSFEVAVFPLLRCPRHQGARASVRLSVSVYFFSVCHRDLEQCVV